MNNINRPADAVDRDKRENLISFSSAYIKRLPEKYKDRQVRIDVCEVLVYCEQDKLAVKNINYIENAVSR